MNAHGDLLSIALDHLTLARAGLYRAMLGGGDLATPATELAQAVAGLRQAGDVEFVARALLTQSLLHHRQGHPTAAEACLAEAQEIAERGEMALHLADVHLHRARLFRDPAALAEARRWVDRHGYGRRLPELADAERAAQTW
jgi:hypothetical protein